MRISVEKNCISIFLKIEELPSTDSKTGQAGLLFIPFKVLLDFSYKVHFQTGEPLPIYGSHKRARTI